MSVNIRFAIVKLSESERDIIVPLEEIIAAGIAQVERDKKFSVKAVGFALCENGCCLNIKCVGEAPKKITFGESKTKLMSLQDRAFGKED